MPKSLAHATYVLAIAAMAFAASTPALAAVSSPTTFEQLFTRSGAAASVHYRATYEEGGQEHHMEVWRDADRQVLRRTDDLLEVYATHSGTGPDFQLTVVDLKRHIRSDIGRDSLMQVGRFMDWQDIAWAVKHPLGKFRVQALLQAPAAGLPAPAAPCRWAEVDESGKVSRICWSPQLQLPMLMLDADNHPVWRVTELRREATPASRFVPPKAGYVINDADEDIQHD